RGLVAEILNRVAEERRSRRASGRQVVVNAEPGIQERQLPLGRLDLFARRLDAFGHLDGLSNDGRVRLWRARDRGGLEPRPDDLLDPLPLFVERLLATADLLLLELDGGARLRGPGLGRQLDLAAELLMPPDGRFEGLVERILRGF